MCLTNVFNKEDLVEKSVVAKNAPTEKYSKTSGKQVHDL
jgi:hypothetical protein